VKEVQKIFPDWYSYDVHTPIVFNKEKLKYIMDQYWDSKWSKRSIYCNYYKETPVKLSKKYLDCKIVDWDFIKAMRWLSFFSTSDQMVFDIRFMKHLHSMFPKPSKYELF
jgi:hypothetical protein